MKDQLITFETAKLAKEKGFNIQGHFGFVECQSDYNGDDDKREWRKGEIDDYNYPNIVMVNNNVFHFFLRPTQSLLQRWLREIHKINLVPDCKWVKSGYECMGYDLNNENKKIISLTKYNEYKTYEDALEKGLQEALKLIK